MTWSDIPRNPSRTTLRQFAGLWLLFFGGLGCWHLLGRNSPLPGWLLLTLAAGVGLPGLVRPRMLRPVFVGWMMAVFPVGWLVSRALLTVLYYGMFTPVGLWFRLRGRDCLRRTRRTSPSYWQPKPAATGVASYYRQF